MNRAILLLAVAVMAALAGCGGDAGGNGADVTTTQQMDNGDTMTTAESQDSEAPAMPELAMLQFDRNERYVYDVTFLGGTTARTYVDVAVSGQEATVNVTTVGDGGQRYSDTYTVPTNDPDAVIDAMADDIRRGGMAQLLQSRDVTQTFVQEDIAWEVGAEYSDLYGNLTVTGEDTVSGVDCLTYEVVVDGELFEQGCITPELEMPVAWEKYLNSDDMQLSWTLVSYEQG